MYVQFRWLYVISLKYVSYFLAHVIDYRKFKLSTQIEYPFFAIIVSFCECFLARNQWVNFPLEIYNSMKDLHFHKS